MCGGISTCGEFISIKKKTGKMFDCSSWRYQWLQLPLEYMHYSTWHCKWNWVKKTDFQYCYQLDRALVLWDPVISSKPWSNQYFSFIFTHTHSTLCSVSQTNPLIIQKKVYPFVFFMHLHSCVLLCSWNCQFLLKFSNGCHPSVKFQSEDHFLLLMCSLYYSEEFEVI